MSNAGVSLESLQSQLGYFFRQPSRLVVALTHKSCGRTAEFNERLEFLGDAVLELAVSEWLFCRFNKMDEGGLTRIRASLVNASALAEWAHELNLSEHLRFRNAEMSISLSDRILSSGVEAILGAMLLDSNFSTVKNVLNERLEKLGVTFDNIEFDSKSKFQELVQAKYKVTPEYLIVAEKGPSHSRTFTAAVMVNQREMGRGVGRSKREAEQNAAEVAVEAEK